MNTQVLIVGAGPTGLMMACQLQRWGIDFIILDDKPTTTDKSKALAVQARSVEIFEQMDIAGEAVQRGSKAKAVNLVVKDKVRAHVPFGDLGEGLSPYPFVLMLEQNKNEQLLVEYLAKYNQKVLWQHTLSTFTDDGNAVRAIVKDKDGKEEEIQARYIVGADGGKSPVRHLLGLQFEGDTYEHVFFVADTKVHWTLGTDELYILFSSKTFSAFFPMSEGGRFRLVGTMPEKFTDDGSVTFEDIEATIRSQIDIPVTFSDTSWFSVYRVHHRVAASFRKGNAFLVGDAAHVHSPVGAQGMNTGLQDAYNLAWKMAWVIKGIAGDKLLDTYHEERHKVATNLVESTDKAFSIATNPTPLSKFLRFYVVPFIVPAAMHFNAFKTKLFKLVSQIAVKYPHSSVSAGVSGTIRAGERFPYFQFTAQNGASTNSFDFFREAALYIVTYDLHAEALELPAGLNVQQYSIPVNVANSEVLGKTGFGKAFICIIRPDTYIGYISDTYTKEEISGYLRERLCVIAAV